METLTVPWLASDIEIETYATHAREKGIQLKGLGRSSQLFERASQEKLPLILMQACYIPLDLDDPNKPSYENQGDRIWEPGVYLIKRIRSECPLNSQTLIVVTHNSGLGEKVKEEVIRVGASDFFDIMELGESDGTGHNQEVVNRIAGYVGR